LETELNKVAISPLTSAPLGRRQGDRALKTFGPINPSTFLIITLLLLLTLAGAIIVSVSLGATHIPLRAILSALLHRQPLTETQHTILFAIRLPRILVSSIVGAALAVSGLMFQGLFRNPMADPYIIGASGGAALGACIGIVFLSQFTIYGFSATALLAFIGAVLTMTVVYALARSRGRTGGVTLLLAGFAVGTMLTNSTYLFELFDPNSSSGIRIVAAWLHGTIGVPEWKQLTATTCLFALAMVAAFPLMRRLNTLALGDDYAHQLGIRIEATRIAIILVGSLLTAIAVSLGGLISFAGLIIPHVARLILGPNNVRLLAVTAIGGALFLVIADTLARTVLAPSELPVGILMVFLGGPFFIYLLRKGKREYAL
jgi:iron complex transport system permease protein